MTINDISKELGLTKRAIKFYEEKGLLSVPKDENGYRNYSKEHIRMLKTISVYRKLGIGINDIQNIIKHGDESILLQVLKTKETELQDKQAELLELQTFLSTRDVDQAYVQLKYETVAQAIKDAVPGFYGRYFLNHFQPYLQIKIQTKEQEDAYNTIKEFWDNTEIRIPLLMRLSGWIMLRLLPQGTPEQMESKASAKLKLYLDPSPEGYEKLKKSVLDGYRTKRLLRFHPAYIEQRKFMKELQNKGYNDIFIPNMKILSPAYKTYHDTLTSMNNRICAELGLYYDADYNLVRKKHIAK